MYTLTFSRKAAKELKKVPQPYLSKILEKIENLKKDPRPQGCKKLVGFTDLWRIRQGDYRIIYSIEDDLLEIVVLRVSSRGGAYE